MHPKHFLASPSLKGSVVELIPATSKPGPPAKPARRAPHAQGSVTCDIRAVMAENARLRADVQRLKGEVYTLKCRLDEA